MKKVMRVLFISAAAFLLFYSSVVGQESSSSTTESEKNGKANFSDSKPYTSEKNLKATPPVTKRVRRAPATQPDDDTIRIDSTLVMIPVTVSDRYSGEYVSNLSKADFKIFEDGVQQEIAYFGVSQQPLTVLLLLDTSPSTKYKIDEIQTAALSFVRHLNPQDRVEVIKFNEKIRVLARATANRQKIDTAIRKARFAGGTSLYDAVDFSIGKRLSRVKGRKAIVLFTDGVDTTSRNAFFDDTVAQAEKSDTVVFSIFYDTYEKTLRRGKRKSVRELGERKLGRMYVEELATLTGGRMIEPEYIVGGLNRAFEAIANELKHQYNIGFYPSEEGYPGQRKKLKVRIYKPDLNVRARDNYIVKNKNYANNR